jgi:hypothetical protein
MHPECGLRVKSIVHRLDGQIAEYSYCLNDKFEDRVIFKNQGMLVTSLRTQIPIKRSFQN